LSGVVAACRASGNAGPLPFVEASRSLTTLVRCG
jgi:hypothetical protein